MEEYKTRITLVDSSILQTDFDSKSMLDKQFRGGFWNNASKRLFILNEYMKQQGLRNVIHLENDVLLYSDMNYDLDEKIYITIIQEKKDLVSFEEFYNIFNFEIYNKNKNYIKKLIETNLA
jgi:hypothetical protein